jgi:hypothetical protein
MEQTASQSLIKLTADIHSLSYSLTLPSAIKRVVYSIALPFGNRIGSLF